MDGFEMVRRYRAVELQRAQELALAQRSSCSLTATTSTIGTSLQLAASAEPAVISNSFLRSAMAIVGMSANSDMLSQSLAADAGMNAFLAKPFSFADINAVLSQFK